MNQSPPSLGLVCGIYRHESAHNMARRITGVAFLEDTLDCSVSVEMSTDEDGRNTWVARTQLRHIGDCFAKSLSPRSAVANLRHSILKELRRLTKRLVDGETIIKAAEPLPEHLAEGLRRMVAQMGEQAVARAAGLSRPTLVRALHGVYIMPPTRDAIRELVERSMP